MNSKSSFLMPRNMGRASPPMVLPQPSQCRLVRVINLPKRTFDLLVRSHKKDRRRVVTYACKIESSTDGRGSRSVCQARREEGEEGVEVMYKSMRGKKK